MKRPLMVLAAVMAVGIVGMVYARSLRPATVLGVLERERPVRGVTPRFSVQTKFQPCVPRAPLEGESVPRERCGRKDSTPDWVSALAATSELLDADSLQGSALAGVLWWDRNETSLNGGIEKLSEALRQGGDSVSLLVDLSGMHLVRARELQSLLDVIVALHYARVAVRMDPRNEAALFNAALAAELIPLDAVADRAWGAYLAVDSTSRWAGEARERRDLLVLVAADIPAPDTSFSQDEAKDYARTYPQEARERGWSGVLGQWGDATLRGDEAAAAAQLELAHRLGTALQKQGDWSLADAVRYINAAAGNRAATRKLAEAHKAYGSGHAFFERGEGQQAQRAFQRVIALNPQSPVLLSAARVGLLVLLDKDRLQIEADALIGQLDSIHHPSLLARVRWAIGMSRFREGDISKAAELLGAAALAYDRLRETANRGVTASMAALSRVDTGDTLIAYRDVHSALLELRSRRNSKALHNVLADVARYAARNELWFAALAIQEEDVIVAKQTGLMLALAEALPALAEFRTAAGDRDSIGADLDSAQTLIRQIGDTALTRQAQKQLQYVRTLTAEGSAVALDSVVEAFQGEHVGWWMLALAKRAELRLSEKDLAGAIADLNAIIEQVLGLTVEKPGFHMRSAGIEQARRRFDDLAMLHAREGRLFDALQAVEAGRVSFAPNARPRRVRDVRITPPPGAVALEYALIGDTLLTWVIRHDSTFLRVRTIDRDSLLLSINRTRAALESPRRARLAQPHLVQLYGWLIRPVAAHFQDDTPLVILADGEIAGVPMIALRETAEGEYLLEKHRIRYAPSLAEAAEPPPAREVKTLRALLVANPRFDPREHPDLDSLAYVDAEVESIAELYEADTTLSADGATLGAFLDHAPRVDVIHFAGHALFDDTRPDQSFLVLAGRERLSARMADSLDLRGVRLVVLSACRTARSRQGRSGGLAGLSGALLSAGAGGVVGSLWNVDDKLTRSLMVRFHTHYSKTGDAAEALRQAQIGMLREKESPAAWAAFRYVGR